MGPQPTDEIKLYELRGLGDDGQPTAQYVVEDPAEESVVTTTLREYGEWVRLADILDEARPAVKVVVPLDVRWADLPSWEDPEEIPDPVWTDV